MYKNFTSASHPATQATTMEEQGIAQIHVLALTDLSYKSAPNIKTEAKEETKNYS